jgi:hypothetical protein
MAAEVGQEVAGKDERTFDDFVSKGVGCGGRFAARRRAALFVAAAKDGGRGLCRVVKRRGRGVWWHDVWRGGEGGVQAVAGSPGAAAVGCTVQGSAR